MSLPRVSQNNKYVQKELKNKEWMEFILVQPANRDEHDFPLHIDFGISFPKLKWGRLQIMGVDGLEGIEFSGITSGFKN